MALNYVAVPHFSSIFSLESVGQHVVFVPYLINASSRRNFFPEAFCDFCSGSPGMELSFIDAG